jgi:phage terminase large subunit GpA-like protein
MILGVDSQKTRLFDRLAKQMGVRFSDELPLAYYEQLTSERPVVRYARGQPHRVFERYPGRLAEALECLVYALAARTAITTPSPHREAELSGKPVSTPIPTVIRSAWLERSFA